MQAVTTLPMTAKQSLHTTNLAFRMINLPNLAPISCVVESAKTHLNVFFSAREEGFYLFEQQNEQMNVCVQIKSDGKKAVKRVAVWIDFDNVSAFFRVKGEEKGLPFKEFAARLGLSHTENLAECRALALSKLNLKFNYSDASYDLLMTPHEDCKVDIVEINDRADRHTFIKLTYSPTKPVYKSYRTDTDNAVYAAMSPILMCVESTFTKEHLDRVFCHFGKEGHCYVRFSEMGNPQMTLVTHKAKIKLPFMVTVLPGGNKMISWIGKGNYIMDLPEIIFRHKEYGYKSTELAVFNRAKP